MTILLVDDETDTRTVARLALQQIGDFTVIEAASGEEALEIAARHHPDAIILDVMMPVMDGPDVLAALRANPVTAGIPVLFLTAKAMPEELDRLRRLGVLAIHTKPFEPESFATDVHDALARRTTGPPAPGGVPASSVASAASKTSTGIDTAALRKLQGLTTDTGSDLVEELVALFATNTPDVCRRLRAHLSAGPAAAREVERLAHSLKGSALTLGASEIAIQSRQIEHAAREQRLEEIEALVARIEDVLGPTVDQLRAAQRQLPPGKA